MKEFTKNDEIKGLVTNAFEHSAPDEDMKVRIFDNIMEECESTTRKRTSMESLFMVRRVCEVCIAALVMIILASSALVTLYPLDRVNHNLEQKESSAAREDYRLELADILRGNNKEFYLIKGFEDNKLADAIEKCSDKYEEKKTANYVFTFLGVISGSGITDTATKPDEKVFAAVRVENTSLKEKLNQYQWNINEAVMYQDYTDGTANGENNIYTMGNSDVGYRAEDGQSVYMIIDISEYRAEVERSFKICVTSSDLMSGDHNDDKTYPFIYDKSLDDDIYNASTIKEHAVFDIDLKASDSFKNSNNYSLVIDEDTSVVSLESHDSNNITKANYPIASTLEEFDEKYSKDNYYLFTQSHSDEVSIDGIEFKCEEDKTLLSHLSGCNSSNGIFKAYLDLKDYEVHGREVDTISYEIEYGSFYEKVPVTLDEYNDHYSNSHVDDTYLGFESNGSDTEKPYVMYKNLGKRFSVPYDKQNASKYGIMLSIEQNNTNKVENEDMDSGEETEYFLKSYEFNDLIGSMSVRVMAEKSEKIIAMALDEAFAILPGAKYCPTAHCRDITLIDGFYNL